MRGRIRQDDAIVDGPCGLLFTEEQAVYVASFNTDNVLRYHWPTGRFGGSLVPRGSGLDGPMSIIFGQPICNPKFIHPTSLQAKDPRSR